MIYLLDVNLENIFHFISFQ